MGRRKPGGGSGTNGGHGDHGGHGAPQPPKDGGQAITNEDGDGSRAKLWSPSMLKPSGRLGTLAGAVLVATAAWVLSGERWKTTTVPVGSSGHDSFTSSKPAPTLTPATEMARGLPNTLQRALYDDGRTPFANFTLVNDYSATEPVDILWSGRLLAIAAPERRVPVQTWIGHEFGVKRTWVDGPTTMVRVDGSFDAVVVRPDGSVEKTWLAKLDPPRPLPGTPPARVQLVSTAKSIKQRNLSGHIVHQYWVPDNGQDKVYQGVVGPNSETTTNSYLTHRFQYWDKTKTKVLYDFRVNEAQDVYAYVDEATADPYKLLSHKEELEFAADYKARTGRSWYSFYPHEPVKTFTWPADYIGQKHKVKTDFMPQGGPGWLELEVLATQPRVFLVRNILAQAEADEIIRLAKKSLDRSSVQARDENGHLVLSDTRTSKNAWVGRERGNGVIDRLFRRASDLLRVNESRMHHDTNDGMVEAMQVVHYKKSAHYAPHHDWGVQGGPHTRLITLLLYLQTPPPGQGKTAFPKAQVGLDDGLRLHPGGLNGVLFYSQFPDGNVDDLSLHEAEAVDKGEKWLANFWVHDSVSWRADP